MGAFTLIGAVAAAVFWCLLRVFGAVAQRVGERLAAWLFPDNQPVTFRLAVGLATLADHVSPRTILFVFVRDRGLLIPTVIFYRSPSTWKGPKAVVEELRDDLASGRTVKDPVHMVWPLLPIAAAARLHNALQLSLGGAVKLAWLPLTVLGPAVGGLIRGWPGAIALCCPALAGDPGLTVQMALAVLVVGSVLAVGQREVVIELSARYTWISPAFIGLAMAYECSSSSLYPLADLGNSGIYVVIGLSAMTFGNFLAGVVQRNLTDPLVESILWKPSRVDRRQRLRVTRLQYACEFVRTVTEAAALYGVATLALFSVFAIGTPVVWVTAGLVATIALSYSRAAPLALMCLRPTSCIGDVAPEAEVLAGSVATSEGLSPTSPPAPVYPRSSSSEPTSTSNGSSTERRRR